MTVLAFNEDHLGDPLPAEGARLILIRSGFFSVNGRGWSEKFRRAVMHEAAQVDIVHNHGLWMWPNKYAREAAVAAGKPLIISPRGMLEAWSLGRSKLRKAVAWRLFEKRNLQSAAMFHATAEPEAESILEVTKRLKDEETKGLKHEETAETEPRQVAAAQDHLRLTNLKLKTTTGVPVVVAPNGVDFPDLARRPRREVLEEKFPALRDRRWVVFMSRLHPKKGIDVLLRAWALQNVEHEADGIRHTEGGGDRAQGTGGGGQGAGDLKLKTAPHRGAVLVLAGPDLVGYGKDVRRMVQELGIEDSVVITGEVLGKEKDCLLGNAHVFVLPSYSENFGNVVAEAMAWSRPVIASTATPWRQLNEAGAGWWVAPTESELARTLAQALELDAKQAAAKGQAGRNLVETSYSWGQAAEKLLAGYASIGEA